MIKFKITSNANEVVQKLQDCIARIKTGITDGSKQTAETWKQQVVLLADEKFFLTAGGYVEGLKIIEPVINGSVVSGGLQNNKAYAIYREYGTGIYAQKGNGSPTWYVHESMIEGGRERFDQYANGSTIRIVDTKSNGRFYRVEGTKPDNIFITAFDSTLDVAIDNVVTAIQTVLRGI